MKKTLLVLAVLLVAAGCNAQPSADNSAQQPTNSSASGSTEQMQQTGSAASGQIQSQAQVQSNVQVNNVDDAINAIEKNSTSEQTNISSSNDSDLTSTDSTDLNSYTGVPNGN